MNIELVQLTEEHEGKVEWLEDSYFEGAEVLIEALKNQPFDEYRVDGLSVWASIQAHNAAVEWYLA